MKYGQLFTKAGLTFTERDDGHIRAGKLTGIRMDKSLK